MIPIETRAVSTRAAAQAMGIGATKLYAEMKAGKIARTKLGRRTVVLVSEIDSYLRRQTAAPLVVDARPEGVA